MLKNKEKSFLFIQIFSDIAVICSVWFVAYFIRFNWLPDAQPGLGKFFLKLTPLVIIPTLYFLKKNGLYRSLRFSTRYKEISAILAASFQGILAFVILLYFFAPERISRVMLLMYGGFMPIILVTVRMIIRNILRSLRRKGYNLRHYLLIGDSTQMREYIKTINGYKDAGIRFYGIIDGGELSSEFGLKNIELLPHVATEELRPDAIVIGLSGHRAKVTEDILKKCHNDLVPIHILPDLTYSLVGTKVEDFSGIPMLTLNSPNISFFGHLLKRLFDVLLVGIGLILISPFLSLLGILVKLTSPGPVFYGQKRMGLDGSEFHMWKFRSMRVSDNPQEKPGWTTENDPRRTKFGTFLRKTSLDELPQLWNVFVGNMSLVGPRPEQPHFVEKFKDEIPAYMLRHKMKAGITGWAQVNGWRGDTSIEKRIECDIYYIKNWSILLDIKILLLTFWKGFVNKNAY